MMAMSKQMLEQEPGDIEMLLPWHAAGTLNARDARRVDEALARDRHLDGEIASVASRRRRVEAPRLLDAVLAVGDPLGQLAARDLDERLGKGALDKVTRAFLSLDADVPEQRHVLDILRTDRYVAALPAWWRSVAAAVDLVKKEAPATLAKR